MFAVNPNGASHDAIPRPAARAMNAELHFRLLSIMCSLRSYEMEDEFRKIICIVERGLDRRAEAERSEGRERLAALLASTNRSLGQVGRHARARLRSGEHEL